MTRPRLQWRADYFRAPTDAAETEACRAYLAQVFDPRWDGGYDPDLYPSFDAALKASPRPWVGPLYELGAFDLAQAQEAQMRLARLHG